MAENPIIKIKKLNVAYFLGQPNEVRALKDIDLNIYPGEFVVFFGPSGCGKSTLLYAITGLEKNVMGSIVIEGKNITKIEEKQLEEFHQRKTGMIFQAYYLISSLSVLRNITLPQVAIGVSKKDRTKKAQELMKRFGIDAQASKLPNELSGGQQQRVAICRALINEPDMLFADEPVGNLDSKSARDVLKLLVELNEKQKKTIIFVTHNPAHLNIAHRVFYMKDGEIVDIKINKEKGQIAPVEEEADSRVTVSKDLELLARTFSNISEAAGNLLIPFKAREIVLESLTSLTSDEIGEIEDRITNLLSYSIYDNDSTELFNFLDRDEKNGGLGLDKRKAEKITEKISNIIGEIKFLMRKELDIRDGAYTLAEEVVQARDYLIETFEVKVRDENILKLIDKTIENRLKNSIGRRDFQKKMDLPIKRGGAGLDRRVAKRMSQRLELLILGKYK